MGVHKVVEMSGCGEHHRRSSCDDGESANTLLKGPQSQDL